MSIAQDVADRILAKCGRCCCICRRFAPLHLQVHHIEERSSGGLDDEDNLIAVCLTCHSDVHTQTLLSRRFTREELKLHRANVFRLVKEGKLPAGPPVQNFLEEAISSILSSLQPDIPIPGISQSAVHSPLSGEAITILLHAVQGDGHLFLQEVRRLWVIECTGWHHQPAPGRESAKFKSGFDALQNLQYIDWISGLRYAVTERGYQAADLILAAGKQT